MQASSTLLKHATDDQLWARHCQLEFGQQQNMVPCSSAGMPGSSATESAARFFDAYVGWAKLKSRIGLIELHAPSWIAVS